MNYTIYTVKVSEGGTKYWLNEKGQRHNEHGPAIEYADGSKSYYVNGKYYSHEAWKRKVEKSKVKELTVSDVSKLLGYDVKIVKESER